MATFNTLAQELRQNIYQLAFETAVAEDIQLNDFLRKHLRSCGGRGSMRAGGILEFFKDILGQADEWHHTTFIPSIHKTAASLHAALPDLADEINFVLKKNIDAFTVAENAENTALETARWIAWGFRFPFESSVSEYGEFAKARGELYDLDDSEGYQIEGTLTEVQAKLRHRFKSVLNRLYDA